MFYALQYKYRLWNIKTSSSVILVFNWSNRIAKSKYLIAFYHENFDSLSIYWSFNCINPSTLFQKQNYKIFKHFNDMQNFLNKIDEDSCIGPIQFFLHMHFIIKIFHCFSGTTIFMHLLNVPKTSYIPFMLWFMTIQEANKRAFTVNSVPLNCNV